MASPSKLLNENETVELDLRPHWWFMVPRLSLLALAVLLGIYAIGTDVSWLDASWFKALAGLLVLAALVFFLLR